MTKTLILKLLGFMLVAGVYACGGQSGHSALKYYGADSQEAFLDFTATVEMAWHGAVRPDDIYNPESKLYKAVKKGIDYESSFLFGVFTQHSEPTDFADSPGEVRNRPETKILGVEKLDKNTMRVTYSYHDVASFKKSLFPSSEPFTVNFRLPVNPDTIYAKGKVPIAEALDFYQGKSGYEYVVQAKKKHAKTFNLCTDAENNTEADLWYFWNPDQPGCPAAMLAATAVVTAQLTPKANTVATYPQYDRLTEHGVMKVKYLVGIDETFDPTDLGAQGFEKAFKLLTLGKDALTSSDAALSLTDGEKQLLAAVPDADDVKFSTVSESSTKKVLAFDNGSYKVEVTMELYDPTSDEFGDAAIDGMRHDDVFIYDGHSGLGDFLGVDVLFNKGETLDADKYQIFFFDGCSTYAYYNLDYFDMKATPADPKGTRSLNIITTSIGAAFETGPGSDAFLIRHLADGRKASYQKILDDIYAIDPAQSALTQVNGDEDNPRPSRP